MTGRDLIVYILQNNLEDSPVFTDGKLTGFLTVSEAAKKFNVGERTIEVWCEIGSLDYVSIGKTVFIPNNAQCVIAQ